MKSSFLKTFKRALVLCPHTDDEFGCAGTVIKLLDAGITLRYVALSRCEESVPAGYPKDILETECRKCLSSLGVIEGNISILDYPVRHFPTHRQSILENFVAIKNDYNPDLVLLPSKYDNHQDHKTVYNEGLRAFKLSTLLGYELPQNLITFDNSAFVQMTEHEIDRKIKALACYESQKFRSYASTEFLKGLAKVRGVQCDAHYAESFELIRLIIR